MSNNKFHFEFEKRIPKIQDFFPFMFKKEITLYLKYIIFICLKKKNIYIYIFLNYNICKLLNFTQKNRRASEHVCERVLRGQYIYIKYRLTFG